MLPEALAESMASEKPVFMDVRPWGSMSSIVTHSFIRGNRNLAWEPQGNSDGLLSLLLHMGKITECPRNDPKVNCAHFASSDLVRHLDAWQRYEDFAGSQTPMRK